MVMQFDGIVRFGSQPDLHALFSHYNDLYFKGALVTCTVAWKSSRRTIWPGSCRYLEEGKCEIHLSEPLLRFRHMADIKNILLHEMIHAFLYVDAGNKIHRYHGRDFTTVMNIINASDIIDPQRPKGGYNICILHHFHKEVNCCRVYYWMCESCSDVIKRDINKKPSLFDCVNCMGHDSSCGSSKCHWHRHKKQCNGKYNRIPEPPPRMDNKGLSKDAKETDRGTSAKPSSEIRLTTQKLRGEKSVSVPSNETTELPPFPNNVVPTNPGTTSIRTSSYKEMQAIQVNPEGKALVLQVPKRPRTVVCRKKRKFNRNGEENQCQIHGRGNDRNTHIVPLRYGDEEIEKDIILALINKKTIQRKTEKRLMEAQKAIAVNPEGKALALQIPKRPRTIGCQKKRQM